MSETVDFILKTSLDLLHLSLTVRVLLGKGIDFVNKAC